MIFANTVGIENIGGNNLFSNSQICVNTDGFRVRSGSNNAHFVMTNCNVNHNTNFNIDIRDTTLGGTFNGCNIYEGDIYLKNANAILFSECQIDVKNYYFENSFFCKFKDVDFRLAYSNNFNLGYNSTNCDILINFFKLTGVEPIVTISGNATASIFNHLIKVNSASLAITVTLPQINKLSVGKEYIITDLGDAATNNITINTTGGNTIDGAASKTINTNRGVLVLRSTSNSEWQSVN